MIALYLPQLEGGPRNALTHFKIRD